MREVPNTGPRRRIGLPGSAVAKAGAAALGALVATFARPGQALARVEPPVTQGVPGEASQAGLWLWILVVLAVVAAIGAIAWTKTFRRRDEGVDVYALVGRAIEANPAA